MKYIRKISLFSPVLLLSLFVIVFAQQPKSNGAQKKGLVLEIAMSQSFYIPASGMERRVAAFVRVPATANNQSLADPVSAIKLMPEMVGDKMKVTVSAISGNTSGIKTCRDWNTLKESPIASYTISEGEEVTVPQLAHLGANFKDGKLTFKAVSYKAAPQDVVPVEGSGGCGCGWCGRLSCCPNPGFCIECSPCGSVCCAPQ